MRDQTAQPHSSEGTQIFDVSLLLLPAVATAPLSAYGIWLGPGAHLRARGLLVEAKMSDLRRKHGPPRGGGGGCRTGCLIIAAPVIVIFIVGLVLTLVTRLG